MTHYRRITYSGWRMKKNPKRIEGSSRRSTRSTATASNQISDILCDLAFVGCFSFCILMWLFPRDIHGSFVRKMQHTDKCCYLLCFLFGLSRWCALPFECTWCGCCDHLHRLSILFGFILILLINYSQRMAQHRRFLSVLAAQSYLLIL